MVDLGTDKCRRMDLFGNQTSWEGSPKENSKEAHPPLHSSNFGCHTSNKDVQNVECRSRMPTCYRVTYIDHSNKMDHNKVHGFQIQNRKDVKDIFSTHGEHMFVAFHEKR